MDSVKRLHTQRPYTFCRACIASVSLTVSARSRSIRFRRISARPKHISLYGCAKIGARAKRSSILRSPSLYAPLSCQEWKQVLRRLPFVRQARPQQQIKKKRVEGKQIFCRPGPVEYLRDKNINGKLILTPRYGSSYSGLNGEAPPERGAFFKLTVYERVGHYSISKCHKIG